MGILQTPTQRSPPLSDNSLGPTNLRAIQPPKVVTSKLATYPYPLQNALAPWQQAFMIMSCTPCPLVPIVAPPPPCLVFFYCPPPPPTRYLCRAMHTDSVSPDNNKNKKKNTTLFLMDTFLCMRDVPSARKINTTPKL